MCGLLMITLNCGTCALRNKNMALAEMSKILRPVERFRLTIHSIAEKVPHLLIQDPDRFYDS